MKILSYILSVVFAIVFLLLLVVFHPLQWLGLQIKQTVQQFVVEILNWFLIKALLILGAPVRFKNEYQLPNNQSLIFVANHQSMFDIPPIIWHLRRCKPKFVSKIELAKGVPSISFNLRHGGACLIDRKDRTQAINALNEFGKRIHDNKWSAVIFPEGTRSRDGKLKDFSYGGLKTIIAHNPETMIVPISINNSWKVFKYGKFPLGVFSPIKVEVHKPISIVNKDLDAVLKQAEQVIKNNVISN